MQNTGTKERKSLSSFLSIAPDPNRTSEVNEKPVFLEIEMHAKPKERGADSAI